MYPNTPLQALLGNLDACTAARQWADDKTLAEAWDTCDDKDWLMWLVEKVVSVPCICDIGTGIIKPDCPLAVLDGSMIDTIRRNYKQAVLDYAAKSEALR